MRVKLSRRQRTLRLIYYQSLLTFVYHDWRKVINGVDGRVRIWRRKGERFRDKCIQQYDRWKGRGVMVWGGISANYRTTWVLIRGNSRLNSQRLVTEVIDTTALPFMQAHAQVTMFQQDNATPHSSAMTQSHLSANAWVIRVMACPPNSPALNPIEHVWDIIIVSDVCYPYNWIIDCVIVKTLFSIIGRVWAIEADVSKLRNKTVLVPDCSAAGGGSQKFPEKLFKNVIQMLFLEKTFP